MNIPFLRRAVPGVQELKPYQPGKPIAELEREYGVSDIVKLASNENPLGPGSKALEVISRALPELARYPDGNGFDLKTTLAKRHGVDPACITLGNGSNDVLVLLAEAFLQEGLEAVYSQFSFAVYMLAVKAAGGTAQVAPARLSDMDQPLGHDLEAMRSMITDKTRLVFIANPNNPTGTWLTDNQLRTFMDSVPPEVIVVVDEAYSEYVSLPDYPDCTTWLDRYPNLVVTRTFSKVFGLAGIRVGYSVSCPEIADVLNRIRQPFNVNSLALESAIAALEDEDHVQRSIALNEEERNRVSKECGRLGLRCIPSAGNFVLVDMNQPALPIFDALLHQGVIVRPVDNYGLPNYLRITIGTHDENTRLIEALEHVLEPASA
ncbi:MAG: histidinol-phosphate transaminase [Gammaproteobacteria bacterium]